MKKLVKFDFLNISIDDYYKSLSDRKKMTVEQLEKWIGPWLDY